MTERPQWRKSAFSGQGNCVELADLGDSILVRNSNHPDAGTLTVPVPEFAALIEHIKAGVYDDLA